MSIATRTGDDGTTALLFNRRVPKNHPRVAACGAVDELSAALGLARATAPAPEVAAALLNEQQALIGLMGELSTDDGDRPRLLESKYQRLAPADLARVDALVAAIEARNVRFRGWDIPGASVHHAHLHQARALCRRAEREAIALRAAGHAVPDLLTQYLNRLSDALWLLASVEQSRVNVDAVEK